MKQIKFSLLKLKEKNLSLFKLKKKKDLSLSLSLLKLKEKKLTIKLSNSTQHSNYPSTLITSLHSPHSTLTHALCTQGCSNALPPTVVHPTVMPILSRYSSLLAALLSPELE
jgi:hypothetical protein